MNFLKLFVMQSKCNLHIENFYGDNNHHIIESCFKSFARSIRQALTVDERIKNIIPSSKGTL
jgi:imidazoleglycerol-phosphate dehydratase